MPQLRWEGGKGAKLRVKVKAVSFSEERQRPSCAMWKAKGATYR